MVKYALTYIINRFHASVNLATIDKVLYKNTDSTQTNSDTIQTNRQFVYILSEFLLSTLTMVAKATKTRKWLIMYVKAYFTNVHFLVH